MAILESCDGTLPELPQEVIYHILSLLPIKDGGRASRLSKTWLNAWRTRYLLHFDEDIWYLNPRNSERERFLHYRNGGLQSYHDQKIGINNFRLRFGALDVGEWIQVALKNGVKNLELVGVCEDLVLPGIIFEAKCPLDLAIEGYRYHYPWIKLPQSMIPCQHLKSLHLRRLNLYNRDLQRITSWCPMVEDLIIWECHVYGRFQVTNLSKLKQLEFRYESVPYETVEVEAPSLESLYCSRFRLHMNASQNLKQLQLFEVGITDMFFLDFQYRFPHLEDLTIYSCQNLERIRMSSASLRKMKLDMIAQDFLYGLDIDAPNMTQFELSHFNRYFEELQINAPSMTYFKYRGPSFINKVSFTSASSHCCSHIYLRASSGYASRSTTEYFVYLKEFLKNFSQSEIYLRPEYSVRWDYESFDVKQAKDLDSSVAVQVHQLILSEIFREIFQGKFLDGLLWSCQPKTIRYT